MKRKLATNANDVASPASAVELPIQAGVADQQLGKCGSLASLLSPAHDSLTAGVPIAVSTEWMAWWRYFCLE